MIRKLTILSCCFVAALAVSFATLSEAEAQYRPGHFVGNSTRAITNTTRNVMQRTNQAFNGNRWRSGFNNYTYQNGPQNYQYQNQNMATPTPAKGSTGATQNSFSPQQNTTGSTTVIPSKTYTPMPRASEPYQRGRP